MNAKSDGEIVASSSFYFPIIGVMISLFTTGGILFMIGGFLYQYSLSIKWFVLTIIFLGIWTITVVVAMRFDSTDEMNIYKDKIVITPKISLIYRYKEELIIPLDSIYKINMAGIKQIMIFVEDDISHGLVNRKGTMYKENFYEYSFGILDWRNRKYIKKGIKSVVTDNDIEIKE